MASKTWSLRYMYARLQHSIEQVAGQLTLSTASIPVIYETYRAKDLTTMMCMTGVAMLPTLNKTNSRDGVVDRLLMRLMPAPSTKSIYVGDVVAFSSPATAAKDVVVRRIAALEGEEMVSDDPEDEAFRLPEGHCWVLADNEALPPAEAIDSRSFGPLPVQNILGRIMYFGRSDTAHGEINNSPEALEADRPVLEAELDVEKLVSCPC